jgi:hypothetical protein
MTRSSLGLEAYLNTLCRLDTRIGCLRTEACLQAQSCLHGENGALPEMGLTIDFLLRARHLHQEIAHIDNLDIFIAFGRNQDSSIINMAPLPPDVKDKPLPPRDDPLKPINGYPSVACMMGRFPDLAVFRRFRALNAKSLLYRQAELVQLELDLHRLELQDHNISPTLNSAKYASDWYYLSSEQGNQWGMIMKIRKLLDEYSKPTISAC